MNVRLFAAALALAIVPFATAADEENPYKKAKVGDFANYKMTTKIAGFNVEGTMTQSVTAKDDKEITIETTVKVSGMDIAPHKETIDLTKPFDPSKATGSLPAGTEAKVEKLKDGKEKLKVGTKDYDCKWETYKMKIKTGGQEIEFDMKVWQAKDLNVPMVKLEMSADIMGNKMDVVMEMTDSGNKEPAKSKEPEKK
jgi:3D (Asp-Asp-Asp) domain-containing protein